MASRGDSPALSEGLHKRTKQNQMSTPNVFTTPHELQFLVVFFVFLYILVLIWIPSLMHRNYLREDAYVFNFFMIGFLVRFGFGVHLPSLLAEFLVSGIYTEEQSWWGPSSSLE